jgi:hypothetical protein
MRKIRKEANRVQTISMEAACSERALMGFPDSSKSTAQAAPGASAEKRRKRIRRFGKCREKFIFLPGGGNSR